MFRFRVPALLIAVSIAAAFFFGWRLGYDCFWDFRLLNLFPVIPLAMGVALAIGGRRPRGWVAIVLVIVLMGHCISLGEVHMGPPRQPPMPVVLTSIYAICILAAGVWCVLEKESARRWKMAMIPFFLLASLHLGWLLRLHFILQ